MTITNQLVSDSFSFKYSNLPLTTRVDEQEELDKILIFCKEIGELVYYEEELLEVEVEAGILFYELLYGMKCGTSRDGTDFLREMITKKCRSGRKKEDEAYIMCSCGTYGAAVHNLTLYAKARQQHLRTLKDHHEYGSFMVTCFPNCIFADGCVQELTYVQDFADHMEEITDCLSLLDEKAVRLYEENHNNLEMAMKRLQIEMHRTCAPDPKHKQFLKFEFTYEQDMDGKRQQKKKSIECQPHFKLIRDDSDLRVYFYWKDHDIGEGEKVLIGRIGRHPWKK